MSVSGSVGSGERSYLQFSRICCILGMGECLCTPCLVLLVDIVQMHM